MIGYNVTELIAECVVARKLKTTGKQSCAAFIRIYHGEAIKGTEVAYGESYDL
jgi:hypothetical protein